MYGQWQKAVAKHGLEAEENYKTMFLKLLKGKLHKAIVTEADLNYTGSIAIDADLLKASSIIPFEHVEVYNITSGERFTTYAIEAPGGSGTITINGAAAHKAKKGDKVIICAFIYMLPEEVTGHKPSTIIIDENNRIVR